jgi:hypothetical protein
MNMDSEEPLLSQVMIASPCNIGWENMQGDDSVRFCNECKLNVFNTSQMSKKEVNALMADETTSCLRIYRRADGTMMTEDCPVGLRRIRNGLRRLSKTAASIWAFTISVTTVFAQNISPDDKSGAVLGGLNTVKVDSATREDKARQSAPGYARTGTETQKRTETKEDADSPNKADFSAANFLEKAEASLVKKDYQEAERNFKEATSALANSNHDPNFEKLVWREYARFLTSQNRMDEAARIQDRLTRRVYPVEPTVLDGRRYYSVGRDGRHQKTSPTLPPGAPIPDSE